MNGTLSAITTVMTAVLALLTGYIGAGQQAAKAAIARAHTRLDQAEADSPTIAAAVKDLGPGAAEILAELHKTVGPAVAAEIQQKVTQRYLAQQAPATPKKG